MNVYLAGTISKNPKHLLWRTEAALEIRRLGHKPLSPLRFQNPESFTGDGLHDAATPDSFFVRSDIADLKRSDVVLLAFFAGAKRQSIGTWSEFAVATVAWHKPVIVITDDPDVADHPFIKLLAAIVVPDLDKGLSWLAKYLT